MGQDVLTLGYPGRRRKGWDTKIRVAVAESGSQEETLSHTDRHCGRFKRQHFQKRWSLGYSGAVKHRLGKALAAYVDTVRRSLGLLEHNFQIEVLAEGAELCQETQFWARVETFYALDTKIELNRRLFEEPKSWVRHVFVHEMLHVLLDRMTSPVAKALQLEGEGAFAIAVELEEGVVDRLTRIIAPSVPFPPKELYGAKKSVKSASNRVVRRHVRRERSGGLRMAQASR